jgi:hypothetical protein
MFLVSMKPVAAEIMAPTNSPTATEQFRIKGAPKSSTRRMVIYTEKPNPIKEGSPQGRGSGALIFGHNLKNPVPGLAIQGPLPPAQLFTPLATKDPPMQSRTIPVTRLGKIFIRVLGLMRLIRI